MQRKGMASIATLIGILVFLLVIFVAALPVINGALKTSSDQFNCFGSGTYNIVLVIPMFLLLGAIATIAFGLLTG